MKENKTTDKSSINNLFTSRLCPDKIPIIILYFVSSVAMIFMMLMAASDESHFRANCFSSSRLISPKFSFSSFPTCGLNSSNTDFRVYFSVVSQSSWLLTGPILQSCSFRWCVNARRSDSEIMKSEAEMEVQDGKSYKQPREQLFLDRKTNSVNGGIKNKRHKFVS